MNGVIKHKPPEAAFVVKDYTFKLQNGLSLTFNYLQMK
jgi:hypothetical protein